MNQKEKKVRMIASIVFFILTLLTLISIFGLVEQSVISFEAGPIKIAAEDISETSAIQIFLLMFFVILGVIIYPWKTRKNKK